MKSLKIITSGATLSLLLCATACNRTATNELSQPVTSSTNATVTQTGQTETSAIRSTNELINKTKTKYYQQQSVDFHVSTRYENQPFGGEFSGKVDGSNYFAKETYLKSQDIRKETSIMLRVNGNEYFSFDEGKTYEKNLGMSSRFVNHTQMERIFSELTKSQDFTVKEVVEENQECFLITTSTIQYFMSKQTSLPVRIWFGYNENSAESHDIKFTGWNRSPIVVEPKASQVIPRK